MEIETKLRRFELGESSYVEKVSPIDVDQLADLAQLFANAYMHNYDLRLLNATLKIIDRDDFRATLPLAHAEWADWARSEVDALRRRKGLV